MEALQCHALHSNDASSSLFVSKPGNPLTIYIAGLGDAVVKVFQPQSTHAGPGDQRQPHQSDSLHAALIVPPGPDWPHIVAHISGQQHRTAVFEVSCGVPVVYKDMIWS